MAITVECPCGARLNVKDEMAGRKGKCPKCGASLLVPDPAAKTPSTAGLDFADQSADIRAGNPPCPGCGTQYPEDVVICTGCGIEIRTGHHLGGPPAEGGRIGRQPIRGRDHEDKSFFKFLGEAYYSPTKAFEALGYYILHSRTNLLLVIGLFLVSLFVQAAREAQGAFSFGAAMILVVILYPIALFVKAGVIDIVARVLTGASRFLPLAVVLLFLDGLVGLTSLVLLPFPPDVAATGALVLAFWALILYFIAIMKTYDISGLFAFVIAVGAKILEMFVIFGLVLTALAALFGAAAAAG